MATTTTSACTAISSVICWAPVAACSPTINRATACLPGRRASIESFDHYVDAFETVLDAARDRLLEPVCAVGQSMGAAVLMRYAARPASRAFVGTALLAPLVRPTNWRANRFVYMVAKHLVGSVGRGWVNNTENPEFIELLRKDPLQCRRLPVQWVTAMVEWMHRFETSEPSSPAAAGGAGRAGYDR